MPDRPTAPGGGGGEEIQITPEMLRAGAWVVAELHGVLGEYAAEGLAEDVYRAMVKAKLVGIFLPPDEDDSLPG